MASLDAAPGAVRVHTASSEDAKRRQLVAAKRKAGGLLAAVALVFVVVTVAGPDETWVGYARAAAEASLVGGLADWFAVTALFRHPLGIPVPHTAIVRERKDQFGETLGNFVQESFLTPDSVVERLSGARVVDRAAVWLADPANAERVAGHGADAIAALVDLVHDDDVHAMAEDLVRARVAGMQLAPSAGRALRFFTAGGRHHEVLGAAIKATDRWLDDHRDELRDRFGQRSPWWMPGPLEHRIFQRLLSATRGLLAEMAADPDHELRRRLDARLQHLAGELETSPSLGERAERLKRQLFEHPEVRNWTASLWRDVKPRLQSQAADPDSEMRRRLTEAVQGAARRLRDDPAVAARAQEGAEAGARYVVSHFHGEIAALVSGTIARWDGEETSRRLELLLGRDLQYIRINGTVVGGAAGLVLHASGHALG